MTATSNGASGADVLAEELLTRIATLTVSDEAAGVERVARVLVDDCARTRERLATASRLVEQISALHDLVGTRARTQDVVEAVVQGAVALLGADFGTVRLGDPDEPTVLVTVAAGSESQLAEARAPGTGGRTVAAVPLHEDGEPTGSLLVGTRVPGRVFTAADRELLRRYGELAGLVLAASRAGDAARRAFVDPLTGLPGRELFLDRLENALARAHRDGDEVTVLFVDLDRFKLVNDSLGHLAGDVVLSQVAERLVVSLRRADTIGRIGGDEFVALLHDGDGRRNPRRVAERLIASLQEAFVVEGREVFISASVGIASGDQAAADLLRQADVAMYRAKRLGKGRWVVFEPSMQSEALERLELEADLRRAVERDELELRYQPILELNGARRIVAVEALLRWRHPTRGLLAPADFIPLAEETGLIVPMGRWVLNEACRRAAEWQRRYPPPPGEQPLAISVNLSGVQLAHGDLVDEVRDALSGRIDPATLILEITETVVMQEGDAVIERLHALKDVGIRLAIDDFGTGYSSLRYLSRFRADILKIAKPFIDGLGRQSAEETALSRAIVDLGTVLELQTVAEGIELREQEVELQGLGCQLGQGFLFSRPLDAAALEALFDEFGGRAAVA